MNLSWTSPARADSIEVIRSTSNGQTQDFYLNGSQIASGTLADTNIPAGDVTLSYGLYAYYNGIMSASASNQISVTLAPAPYQVGIGQSNMEEDLNLGGLAQPGDIVWVIGAYSYSGNSSPIAVSSLAGAGNTVYGQYPFTGMAQVMVDSNGMADILVTGVSIDGGAINIYSASDQLLASVTQSVVPPTLGVTSLTPESDANAPTATTATKGGADGQLLFSLTNPDGSAATALADTLINYTLTGTADTNSNYTLGTTTIPAGASSATVPVHAVDDGLVDPTLTGALALASSSSNQYVIASGAGASANFEILDGGIHIHSISFSGFTLGVGDTQTLTATVTGNLTAGVDPITFNYDASALSVSQPTAPTLAGGVETVTVTVSALAPGENWITASDSAGNFSVAEDISVVPPLIGVVVPLMETAGQEFFAAITAFNNVLTGINLASLSADIDWGDDSTSAGTIGEGADGTLYVTGSHTYATPDDFTADVVVSDGAGDTVEATRAVEVSDPGPTAEVPAAGAVSADGTQVALSVLGDDPVGEDDLAYTWSTVGSPPAPVTFDGNGGNDDKNTTATVTAAGDYDFQVTIENSFGQTATTDVIVTVAQVASGVDVTPDSPTIIAGDQQQFTAEELDQFGAPMANPPTFTWTATDGNSTSPTNIGAIDTTGLFTSPITGDGTVDITATASDGQIGDAWVTLLPPASTLTQTFPAPSTFIPYPNIPELVTGAGYQPNTDVTFNFTYTAPADAAVSIEEKGAFEINYHWAADLSQGVGAVGGLIAGDVYDFRLCVNLKGSVSWTDPLTITALAPTSADVPAPFGATSTWQDPLTPVTLGTHFNWTQAPYDQSSYLASEVVLEDRNNIQSPWAVLCYWPPSEGTVPAWSNSPYGANVQTFILANGTDEFRMAEEYQVLGTGKVVISDFSPPIGSVVDLSEVIPPSNLAVANNGNGTFTATFTKGAGDDVTNFYVLADNSGNGDTGGVYDSPGGGTAGSTFTFGLRAGVTGSIIARGAIDRDLVNGVQYPWTRVFESVPVSVPIPPNPVVPAAPDGLTAVPYYYTDSGVQKIGVHLTWDDESSNETSFTLLRSTSYHGTSYNGAQPYVGPFTPVPGAESLLPDTTNFFDTSIQPGTTYYYAVTASNNAGTVSTLATTAPARVFVPTQPANLTAMADNAAGTIYLTWTENDHSAAGFNIQWSSDGTNFVTIDQAATTYGPPATYYTDEDPDFDVKNYYRIVAFYDTETGVEMDSTPSDSASDTPISAPVAVDDTDGGAENPAGGTSQYYTSHGQPLTVSAADGVLANDFDTNDPALPIHVASWYQPVAGGTVAGNADGSFTFTPANGFVGAATFSYIVANSAGIQGDPATVEVDVYAPAPTAGDAAYTLTAQGTVAAPATGAGSLANNVINPEGESLTYSLAPGGNPQHGSLTFNSDGSFSYVANAGTTGWDRFSYVVSDGYATSNVAQVLIEPPGSTYTPPAVGTVPPLPQTVDPTLEGIADGYQAALGAEQKVYAAMSALGGAISTNASATPPTSVTQDDFNIANQNIILGLNDAVQGAYDLYIAQVNVLNNAMGAYMRGFSWSNITEYSEAHALEANVQALPTRIAQWGLTGTLVGQFELGLANFANGADFQLANATLAVQSAEAVHSAANQTIAIAGGAALGANILITGVELLSEEGCAAAISFGLKTVATLAIAQGANYAASAGLGAIATKFGVNPDYVRIAADAVQLICLAKAAKYEREAAAANCFVGSTLVWTTNNGLQPIADIHLGERVDTAVNDGSDPGAPPPPVGDPDATQVDPATWREVDLTMPDLSNPQDSYTLQLLEPTSWISAEGATVGGSIQLSLPELQISGPAQVVSIGACPTIESGGGRVVLGTFQHVSNDIVDVNLAGQSQPLQVTAGHLLWSLDRDGWVAAGNLRQGERLAGENGPVVVESVTAGSTSQTVYNLDVETDHRYLVTSLGVLAHNVNQCDGFTNVSEWMSETSAEYQFQVTGTRPGSAYYRNGVKFDGFQNGELIEAKGPGYSNLIQNNHIAEKIAKSVFDQAQRQLRAADGAPVVWRVAEADFASALQTFFNGEGLAISVEYVKMKW